MIELDRRRMITGLLGVLISPSVLLARRRLLAAPPEHATVRPFAAVPAMDGRGATVHRLFPNRNFRHLDPFVLLDDFHVAKPAGFPEHPHRGFEAFTYMLDGAFHHKDNLGNDSVIRSGGIQRFTSGAGARHSEMPASDQVNSGLQLWVNLPRRLKKMAPEYVGTAQVPIANVGGAQVHTIVGDGSPAVLRTAVSYVDILFDAAAELDFAVPSGHVGIAYVTARRAMVGPTMLEHRDGAVLGSGRISILGDVGSRVALLSGKPHGEPIYQHGPFVD